MLAIRPGIHIKRIRSEITLAILVTNTLFEENNFDCNIAEVNEREVSFALTEVPDWVRSNMLLDLMRVLGDSFDAIHRIGEPEELFVVKFKGD